MMASVVTATAPKNAPRTRRPVMVGRFIVWLLLSV
jgi:hypothetical protein